MQANSTTKHEHTKLYSAAVDSNHLAKAAKRLAHSPQLAFLQPPWILPGLQRGKKEEGGAAQLPQAAHQSPCR